jgi:hypothetical protein
MSEGLSDIYLLLYVPPQMEFGGVDRYAGQTAA